MMINSVRDSLIVHVKPNQSVFVDVVQLKNHWLLETSSSTVKRTSDALEMEEMMWL